MHPSAHSSFIYDPSTQLFSIHQHILDPSSQPSGQHSFILQTLREFIIFHNHLTIPHFFQRKEIWPLPSRSFLGMVTKVLTETLKIYIMDAIYPTRSFTLHVDLREALRNKACQVKDWRWRSHPRQCSDGKKSSMLQVYALKEGSKVHPMRYRGELT